MSWLDSCNKGIFSSSQIKKLIDDKHISFKDKKENIQPASLDLKLGKKAYRLQASFLPGHFTSVEKAISEYKLHEFDIEKDAVLETGCVYLAEIEENLNLPSGVKALANPKSSTGRLDVFTRLISDNSAEFDNVASSYSGPLYLEISPRSFPIIIRRGSKLSQLRFFKERKGLKDSEISLLNTQIKLTEGSSKANNGLILTLGLKTTSKDQIIGYKAKKHTKIIDIDRVNNYIPSLFWEPITSEMLWGEKNKFILDPGEFFILASQEKICIPPGFAAEMLSIDTKMGEFRAHYAGFFDPGFGFCNTTKAPSAKAVMEIRGRDVPFILEHGQPIAKIKYEVISEPSPHLYGAGSNGHYHNQGLSLSKHFKKEV